MNTNTKTRLLIFITHTQILATHALDLNTREYKELNEAAEELKNALESDETILESR